MEIVRVFLLIVLEFGGRCEFSPFNDFDLNVRHGKKKEVATHEDRASTTDSYDEYADFTRTTSPSTEERIDYDGISTENVSFTRGIITIAEGKEDEFANTVDENTNFNGNNDVVTKFLRIVESQQELGDNCTAGTDLNLGEGVVDRYAQERFRVEAEVAVNRANMLSRLWKYMERDVMESEYLLHASVFSMVEFNENIFAAGNCYDKYQYKDYLLFCPYAYRLPKGRILVKNLAVEYKYLGNNSEWFYQARKNAEKVINKKKSYSYGYHTYTWNQTNHTERREDEVLSVSYEDGRWSKPYYDCGGGNIWMLTYTVPFFGYKNDTYFFKGTSGIDIDLRRVDIDQCPVPPGEKSLNIFAASDKCKKETTYCVSIKGLGFRRGSYKCICQKGFYFLNETSDHNYFNGTIIEEEYEKLMMNENSIYNKSDTFQCLPCAEGCDTCVNSKPCVLALNWPLRSVILGLSTLIIICLLILVYFTWRYRNIKGLRAASPVLLGMITLGAFFIYITAIVMYPVPSVITCTLKIWFREIGFSLTYGALMLKTWRISVIFRVRSAKAVKITDIDLLKKLGIVVLIFTTFLIIRTLVASPSVDTVRTADDQKAYLCESSWWDHWFSIMEAMFLAWGIRLCIVVRKAPSEFNESRFISMAIYNEFLLSIFLNVSMFFLHSPANPDLLYIICFCHTQITVTLLLCFIFGSKAYMVIKGHGKEVNGSSTSNTRTSACKFLTKPTLPSTSQNFPSSSSINISGTLDMKMNERVVLEGIQDISIQIQVLKDKCSHCASEKLLQKLKVLHDFSCRTIEEFSVEDFSSALLQERSEDENFKDFVEINRSSGRNTAKYSDSKHNFEKCDKSQDLKFQNFCSINLKNTNIGSSSCLKKYILRRTSLYVEKEKPKMIEEGEDIPMKSVQRHTIIFNVEDKCQYEQVSL